MKVKEMVGNVKKLKENGTLRCAVGRLYDFDTIQPRNDDL